MKDDRLKTRQSKETYKTRSYQEMNDEISNSKELKQKQPTLDPKDFDEIEY